MRSKTRSDDMAKARILKACANGVSQTGIVHQASPNTMKLMSYLILIDEGLIEVDSAGHRVVHRTTPRGLDLIEKFERLHAEMDKRACNTWKS
ncbi:MAG: hypothetical protein HGA93_06875 [Methanothrix sp.]|nr:hypothetical protein [Methanothrix sp.]